MSETETVTTGADNTVADGEGNDQTTTTTEETTSSTAAPVGAPEAYTDFATPEAAKELQVETTWLDAFKADAKAANLTQDAAQKVLDGMLVRAAEAQTAMKEAQAAQVKGWMDTTMASPTFSEDQKAGERAAAKFVQADPELKALLDSTGYGNHPAVFRLFANIGKAMMEPQFSTGTTPGEAKTAAKTLYPNMN